jgi:hypothetical protein
VVVKGSVSDVRMPEGIRRDQFLAWVEQLEDRTTPDWLGLPNNAERVLLANRGQLQQPVLSGSGCIGSDPLYLDLLDPDPDPYIIKQK